ncbi:MAG: alpha-amylase family glycosyl hydrolase [Dysgonomonas sp.]|nr:alpha-amylase family glycosyl hydrolase [Dysgonomonas sp.]
MKIFKFLFVFLFFSLLLSCNDDDLIVKAEETPESFTKGMRDGINYISDDSLGFVLFAPGKETVYLIGDFNDWIVSDKYKMEKQDNRFWIRIGGLEKGKEYICQYLIDNEIRIADPYAAKISDPKNDKFISAEIYPNLIQYPESKSDKIAMVVNTAPEKYSWKVSDFKLENRDNMVIYELLIRDFTEKRSIKGVQEKLDYIKDLGVNAIELMPFNEFEGNDSWGYNPSFYFATDKAYGTANDYKSFIDACHSNGIAVIMDIVLNHSYSQSPMVRMYQDDNGNPTTENPWYNTQSPNTDYSWGYDFNHESVYTKAFVDSVCAYWMQEYKVDGFRFDFTKGFTNTPGNGWAYDASRVLILKRMANEIYKRNPDAIIILEHLADNTEEKVLADAGMYLWGNMNYAYNEATMGWGQSIVNTSYKEKGWSAPHLISYIESHDEERIMFKNKQWGKQAADYDVRDLNTALRRTEAATVIMMTIPGPKMIWQFGELGYDFSINSNESGEWKEEFEDGRNRTGKKPIRWDYLNDNNRKSLYNIYSKMNKLRNTNSIFSTSNFTITENDQTKQVLLKSTNGNICAVANFDVVPVTMDVKFERTGTWEDYFSGISLNVSSESQSMELQPGEYCLYISK